AFDHGRDARKLPGRRPAGSRQRQCAHVRAAHHRQLPQLRSHSAAARRAGGLGASTARALMLAMPMRWLRRSPRIGTLIVVALAACRACGQPNAAPGKVVSVPSASAMATKREEPVPAELPGADVIVA